MRQFSSFAAVAAVCLTGTAGPAIANKWITVEPRQTTAPASRVELRPLISPAELAELMHRADPYVIDIRNPSAVVPLFSYAAGHVPGSVNVPYGEWRQIWADPLAVPTAAELTDFIRKNGLTRSRPVVIVHSSAAKGNFGSAAWVYWVLKTAGFEELAILNGGIRSWQASGQPVSTDATAIVPSRETARLDTAWLATHEDVDAVLSGESTAQLLDARPLQHIAREASLHGSFVMDATSLLTGEAGQAGDVIEIFARVKEVEFNWEYEDVITYCNNGALAAVDWFMASEIAGIPNVRVYGHSLSARNRARASN